MATVPLTPPQLGISPKTTPGWRPEQIPEPGVMSTQLAACPKTKDRELSTWNAEGCWGKDQRNPRSFRLFIGFLKTFLLSCFWVWWSQLYKHLLGFVFLVIVGIIVRGKSTFYFKFCLLTFQTQTQRTTNNCVVTEFLLSHKKQLSFNSSSNPVRQIL